MLLIVTWLVAGPAISDANYVNSLVDAERQWIDEGGLLLVATGARAGGGSDARGVPAAVCDRLDQVEGVRAAAPVSRYPRTARLSGAPGRQATVLITTPGLWGVVGAADTGRPSMLIPANLAADLDLRNADLLALRTGVRGHPQIGEPNASAAVPSLPTQPLPVSIADLNVLGVELAGSIALTALPAGLADACYVQADPAHHAGLRDSLGAILAVDGQPALVDTRLWDSRRDFPSELARRPLRNAFLFSGVLVGLLWVLVQWSRRSQDALYATVGVDRGTRLLIRGTEWAAVALLAGMWGAALGVVLSLAIGVPQAVAWPVVARHAAGTLAVGTALVLGALLTRPPGILGSLKDR